MGDVLVVSIWPLAVVLVALFLVLSVFAKLYGVLIMLISIAVVVWWMWQVEDRVKALSEMAYGGGEEPSKLAVLGFIMGEFIFFSGMMVGALYSVGEWDESIVDLELWGVPMMVSLVLLSSGLTITVAHQYMSSSGDVWMSSLWLLFTIILGMLFEVIQVEEWLTNDFGIYDGVGPSYFYFITGFHGIHVTMGIMLNIILLSVVVSVVKLSMSLSWQLEGIIWYWHFVDVVWLFVLVGLYWYCI